MPSATPDYRLTEEQKQEFLGNICLRDVSKHEPFLTLHRQWLHQARELLLSRRRTMREDDEPYVGAARHGSQRQGNLEPMAR